MSSAYEMLKDVSPDSLRIQTETKFVRVDDDQHESELSYLNIHGTPDAFRWLSQLLGELATTAENTDDPEVGHSVIGGWSHLARSPYRRGPVWSILRSWSRAATSRSNGGTT